MVLWLLQFQLINFEQNYYENPVDYQLFPIYVFKKNTNNISYSNMVTKILKLEFSILVQLNSQEFSIGITLVNNIDQINNAFKTAFIYDNSVIIEKFSLGREHTVSILGNQILLSIDISIKTQFL